MSRVIWVDEFVYFLIEKIRKSQFMWNHKSPLYRNKSRKQPFWDRLVKEMNKEFNPNIPFTYGEIQQKWNNLKSYFAAENLKIYRAQQNGATAEELEKLQCWKFKSKLDFLLANSNRFRSLNKESIKNFSDSSAAFNDSEALQEFMGPSISPSCIKSERSSLYEPMLLEDQSESIAPESEADTIKSNENSAFSVCVSTEIDKLSTDLQITAKKQIFSIIMDLQAEQLKRRRK